MSNPYYTNTVDLIAGNKARASEVEANLDAVQAGFDGVYTDIQARDAAIALKAPINSPAFTGNPTAPTPVDADDDTSLATSAFVKRAIGLAAALNLPNPAGNDRKLLSLITGAATWVNFCYQTPILVTGNVAATVGVPHLITAAAVITLPANPTPGDVVPFRKKASSATSVSFARNGKPIESLSEDFNLDGENDSGSLVYVDGTRGWVLFQT